MTHRLFSGVVSVLAASSLIIGGTAPVAAECGMTAPPQYAAAYQGLAFIGTVTANEIVATETGDLALLTIEVESGLAGDPPAEVRVLGGTRDTGCHHFRAGAFDVGDRLLLSFKTFDEPFLGRPEGVEVAWRALPWVPAKNGGWRFAVRGVTFPESYPDRLTRPDTLRDILALVRPLELPPTDTVISAADPAALSVVPLLGTVLRRIESAPTRSGTS